MTNNELLDDLDAIIYYTKRMRKAVRKYDYPRASFWFQHMARRIDTINRMVKHD
jgi:ethanolamine ammonia-lyase large subunit